MTQIFVFGSNEAGIHGAGAALAARLLHGAEMYRGVGAQGRSYAIPTKGKVDLGDGRVGIGRPLPLEKIKEYVDGFVKYAKENPNEAFMVTQVGTGHAGFMHGQMAPMFADAPPNVWFDRMWASYLPGKPLWGTFDGRNYEFTPEWAEATDEIG
jgi:hypothetical protein